MMQKRLVLAVVLAMAGTLVFCGISLADICSQSSLPAGCVEQVDIQNGAVSTRKIRSRAVTSGKIRNDNVRTEDLADNAVTSAKLDADIRLGDSEDNGSLFVRASNLREFLGVDGNTTRGNVRIGQSGGTGMDVNFSVYDPTEPDYVAHIDASRGLLTLGSGTDANPGDDGDIWVEAGNGSTSVNIDGAGANMTLGYGSAATPGNAGDILLRDRKGFITTRLEGENGWLRLGAGGGAVEDGDISVYNNKGAETVRIDGQTGTVTNNLSGGGLVKAWAKINADGSIADCWRCNTNPTLTKRTGRGWYDVSFTPLATDIRSRPKSIVVFGKSGYSGRRNSASYRDDNGAPDRITVFIVDVYNNGDYIDGNFDVIIY